MSIDTYGRLPFIPERTLRRHDAYEPGDTRFRAAARLQQSLWRQAHGWKAGYQTGPTGKRRRIGNCLTREAAELGANFITRDVANLAKCEIAFRENGALMDEARIAANLLSSAPMVFNVFGPLKLDLKLATRVFKRLFPNFVRVVTGIVIEHAPDRGSPKFTQDFTAYDLIVQCGTVDGRNGAIVIEGKFSETLTEPIARLRDRYSELSRTSGCFKNPDDAALRIQPLQQFWRQQMLAASMLQAELYDTIQFVVVAPTFNNQAQNAIALFRTFIADDSPVPFDGVTLETVVETIGKAGASEIAAALHQRYCNFEAVAALV